MLHFALAETFASGNASFRDKCTFVQDTQDWYFLMREDNLCREVVIFCRYFCAERAAFPRRRTATHWTDGALRCADARAGNHVAKSPVWERICAPSVFAVASKP